MSKYRLMATAAFGIEGILGKEIKNLGFENVSVENGYVMFDADEYGICKANLWLRCAERVFVVLGQFKSTSFENLFDQVHALPWEDYIPADGEFPVNAKSIKSKLFSLSDIQRISKKAVVKKLGKKYGKEWFPETGAKFPIMVQFLKDECIVSIDSSGVGLHKRGYREQGNEAPLKETLACALLYISNWRPFIPLIDPMCGTGTIAIEAALMARNIAPGLNRKFISEDWPIIGQEPWKTVKKEAFSVIDLDKEISIEGYDIDWRSIKTAKENAEKAGVEEDIHFQVRDAKDLSSKKQYGYLVSNPPYGERLSTKDEVYKLYQMMGKAYGELDTWSKYLLTSFEGFESAFGKKATKNRKLYNGKIKCYFYQYYGPKPPRRKPVSEQDE